MGSLPIEITTDGVEVMSMEGEKPAENRPVFWVNCNPVKNADGSV